LEERAAREVQAKREEIARRHEAERLQVTRQGELNDDDGTAAGEELQGVRQASGEPPQGWHRVIPSFDRVLDALSEESARGRTSDPDVHARLLALRKELRRRGPHRRLAHVPEWRNALQQLESDLPNFRRPVQALRHALALAEATGTAPRVAPMLLLGPPGVGKSYFSQRVAELLGAPHALIAFDQPSAGSQLRGSDKHWGNSESGLLFNLICRGDFANPVVLLDEVDKSGRDSSSGADPLDQLHGALERQTAQKLRDASVDIEFDASLVTYIATSNSLRGITLPLLSRFEVFEIGFPAADEAVEVARRITEGILKRFGLSGGIAFERRTYYVLARMSARLMQRTVEKLVAQAVHDRRDQVTEQQVWDIFGSDSPRLH
jgi:ATP-dependent Lon protease